MVRTSTIESAVMLAVFLAVISIHCGTVAVAQTSPTLAPTTSPTTTMGDCKNNAPPANAFVDYIQCGGQYHIQYGGETCCPQGQVCQIVNNYVSKCIPKTTKTSPTTVAITTFTTTTTTMGDCKNTQVDAWCGGQYYMQHGPGLTCCPQGQDCIYINVRESRCKVNPTPSSITTTTVTTTTKTTATSTSTSTSTVTSTTSLASESATTTTTTTTTKPTTKTQTQTKTSERTTTVALTTTSGQSSISTNDNTNPTPAPPISPPTNNTGALEPSDTPDDNSTDTSITNSTKTDDPPPEPDKSNTTTTVVVAVLGAAILFVILFAFLYNRNGKTATLPVHADRRDSTAADRVHFENPMYEPPLAALKRQPGGAGARSLVDATATPPAGAGPEPMHGTADEGGGGGNPPSAQQDPDADYANAEVAAAGDAGNGLVDENNHYDMSPPGRRSAGSNTAGARSSAATATTATTAAAAARRKGKGGGAQCTRPTPSGGVCKNTAIKATLFCKGHTCPIQGCTSGKSTKMATCPEHVHHQSRPESGEVVYDSFGSASGGGGGGAPQNGGGNAIYAESAKKTARPKKKKQQQQQRGSGAVDANATYATPMRPVPEQDYVTLNEMPSNDEASVVYDVPTASASAAGAAVPEPTKVGSGAVKLNGASQQVGSEDEEEMDC